MTTANDKPSAVLAEAQKLLWAPESEGTKWVRYTVEQVEEIHQRLRKVAAAVQLMEQRK